jgi:uncharacterized Zn-binding protein involved in type VI secretion
MLDALSHTVDRTLAPLQSHRAQETAENAADAPPPPPPNPARTVQQTGGAALGMINMPVELMNTGFAVATASIAKAFPTFGAATLTSMYVAPPHGHLHPPSFTPPATPAPVPLPSFGPVLIGTCVQVLINGLPAARAGDIGMAVTCGGFFPAFEVFTGSSKVFIGGMRAARITDICRACQPAMAGAVRGAALAMAAAGAAVSAAGVAADTADADAADARSDAASAASEAADAASMAAALSLSASMTAAAAASDIAALAMTALIGKDIAAPPIPGALVQGSANVQIGGFPMVNFPNVALKLLGKLKGLRGRRRRGPSRRCKNC